MNAERMGKSSVCGTFGTTHDDDIEFLMNVGARPQAKDLGACDRRDILRLRCRRPIAGNLPCGLT